MTDLAVYEGEVVAAQPPATLFRTDDPVEVVQRASAVATELARVIERQGLSVSISGGKHVKVEGWTLLGTLLGVFPSVEWSRPMEGGWEAKVNAVMRDGSVIGGAEAQCTRSERTWASRDDYALRSMAQTRATSKALRTALGFVMSMAGYEATPAEEMPSEPAASSQFKAPTPSAPAASGPMITNDQKKQINAAITAGLVDKAVLKSMYGAASTGALTRDQAAEIIAAIPDAPPDGVDPETIPF